MKSKRSDWVHYPTKKHLVVYGSLWFTGVALIVLSATNFFTENPFVRKNTLFLILFIFSIIPLIQMVNNYFANKNNDPDNTRFQNQ
jgi:hypothetical protein